MDEARLHSEAAPQASTPGVSTTSKSSLRYMPGLDVMRGLAITMVLLYHGFSPHLELFYQGSRSVLWWQWVFEQGAYGVHLFFILSGFLITGILLDGREQTDYFRNFYLRRILRILPAYLLVLLVLMSTRYITGRYLIVSLLYFCNMTRPFGVAAQYGPLWSLSVEEQFYVVWPLVVHRIRIRSLVLLSIGLILATPVLRFALLSGPTAFHDIYFKTWAVLDFLAAGACMAIAVRYTPARVYLRRAVVPLMAAGLLLLAVMQVPRPMGPVQQQFWSAIRLEPWLLFFSGLILLAYLRPGMASVAAARPLVFLANISYGLYLYHVFIFQMIGKHWPAAATAALRPLPLVLLQFTVQVSVSVLIAYVSRNTLEKFFLRLKPKHQSAKSDFELEPKIT